MIVVSATAPIEVWIVLQLLTAAVRAAQPPGPQP